MAILHKHRQLFSLPPGGGRLGGGCIPDRGIFDVNVFQDETNSIFFIIFGNGYFIHIKIPACMLNIKRLKSLLILLAIPGLIFAQGWLPIQTGEIFNYRMTDKTQICSNIWIDSVHFSPGDSVYYFNRVFKDCGNYVVLNIPVFLQRELHITDTGYLFHSPDNYYIPKQVSPGDEWIIKTTQNIITATLSQVVQDTLFGSADSVKIILLTDQYGGVPDTLIMSKFHGIVKFPDFQTSGKHYTLAGLEKEGVGIQMPDMMDFYDFQAGDRFQFKNKYESYGPTGSLIMTKISLYDITGVQKDTSSVVYHKKGLWKETIDHWDPSWGIDTVYYEYGYIDKNDTIVFNPSSWMNCYIGQVFRINSWRFKLLTYEMSPEFNKPLKSKDDRVFSGLDTAYGDYPYPLDPAKVCVGLGRVYYYYEEYPGSSSSRQTENLQAYAKGGHTYGSFAGFCDLLDPEIKTAMGIPVQDTTLNILSQLILTLPDYFDSYLWSDGSDSNAIVINAAEYGIGTHQIMVETGYFNCVQSDTIQITVAVDSAINTPENDSLIAIEYYFDHTIVLKNVSSDELDYQLQILDGSGREVMEKYYYNQLPGFSVSLSIQDLPSGFFIVAITTGGKIYTSKIIH